MPRPIDPKQIKERVKKHYGDAISSTESTSCCGGGAEARGTYAKLAGYTPGELATLPQDMSAASFGCGNPVSFIDVRPGDVILDLGSGAGLDLLLAAKKVGPEGKVIGVDMTEKMITKALENINRANVSNVEVRLGEMENLPVDDASVDWVISNCVINLCPDKARIFGEIVRVLKPGGRMLVSDIVTTAELPEEIEKDVLAWSGCIAGAMLENDYLESARKSGLTDVQVIGRLDYDREQMGMFSSACCSDGKSALTSDVADQLAGKISSIRVSATKAA
jgi:SAM-dependent methyltransferase